MNDYASLRQSIGGQSSSLQMVAQNHARTYKNAIESLSQSPLPAHRDLAVSLQRNSNVWNHNSQPGLIPHHQQTAHVNAGTSSSENLQIHESGLAGAQSQPQLPVLLNQFAATANNNDTQSLAGLTEVRKSREKYLVYLGDSRGQVHMTSLYLS